ncbi:hypothetical protein HNQ80_001189 [Anaerosolibacter carboniphilus]|uniref:Lipocalin-like domain-containing protein n=1 Tax=Anaerosolibacter carboniphilus TaxID=1417629 RepID=A0A841KST7_9FIRM|nr:hypothetical protein [Anaerosolibacter carboniphilus]MBB6215100.1 hypothetical protein [Anaerosolibacter carboniphilus]
MSKKIVLLLVVLTLFTAIFTGCGSDSNPIVGKWTVDTVNEDIEQAKKDQVNVGNIMIVKVVQMLFNQGAEVEFLKDSTANINGIGMKYQWVDETHLEITPSNGGNTLIYEANLSGDELTLKIQYLTLTLKKK